MIANFFELPIDTEWITEMQLIKIYPMILLEKISRRKELKSVAVEYSDSKVRSRIWLLNS